jgi:hypothetical protein
MLAAESINDRVTLVALGVCLTMLFTALLWQHLSDIA